MCSWWFSTTSSGISAEDIQSTWWLVIRLSSNLEPSTVSMAAIIFWFKWLYKSLSWSLLILESVKFLLSMTHRWALAEKTTKGWNSLLHVDLALLQSRSFFMCGNPKFKRKITAVNFPFHLASMTSIIFVIWAG